SLLVADTQIAVRRMTQRPSDRLHARPTAPSALGCLGGPDPGAPRPSLGQGHPWQRQAAQGKKHTSEPENARRRAGHPGGGERSPSAAHSEGWREGGGPAGVPLPCLCARAVGPRARRAGGARGGAPCLLAAVAQEAGSGPAASSDSNLR
ncbi:unnamed protein product, partial [Prorocentrum cordatum]